MAGANHVQRVGYGNPEGIGRGGAVCALFSYIHNPTGGASECHATTGVAWNANVVTGPILRISEIGATADWRQTGDLCNVRG